MDGDDALTVWCRHLSLLDEAYRRVLHPNMGHEDFTIKKMVEIFNANLEEGASVEDAKLDLFARMIANEDHIQWADEILTEDLMKNAHLPVALLPRLITLVDKHTEDANNVEWSDSEDVDMDGDFSLFD